MLFGIPRKRREQILRKIWIDWKLTLPIRQKGLLVIEMGILIKFAQTFVCFFQHKLKCFRLSWDLNPEVPFRLTQISNSVFPNDEFDFLKQKMWYCGWLKLWVIPVNTFYESLQNLFILFVHFISPCITGSIFEILERKILWWFVKGNV